MKKSNVKLIILGLIVILFAIFSPSIIAEMQGMAWRIVIGLLGIFSLGTGIYKIVLKK